MSENQGWCVRCNKRVLMLEPKSVYRGGNREIMQSVCPHCGGKVNRARGIK
jgi:DNA-directed RNA polymerase subunit RPC12/RpoP